jgi:hypothetical protein
LRIFGGSWVNALFRYFVKSFFGNGLRFFKGAGPGRAGKSTRNFKLVPKGGPGGTAALGTAEQRPVFDRTAVHDGHYDYHQEKV